MASTAAWIKAFRLRTLPLALATVLTGTFLAMLDGKYSVPVIFFTVVTTLFLQILSNLSNDYGDAVKGTDNEKRIGPERAVQTGEINPQEMKRAITLFAFLSLVSGVVLLFFAFGEAFQTALLFFLLGLAAILAAVKYTVGNSAYGYSGWGDLFVFIFFGWVGVMGAYYLNTKEWNWLMMLPASAIGMFSAGVLNLNNMRDMENDALSGKKTIPVRIGLVEAKKYHLLLTLGGWVLLLVWLMTQKQHPGTLIVLSALPLFVWDSFKVLHTKNHASLDPFLKKLALKTLLVALLFGAALLI